MAANLGVGGVVDFFAHSNFNPDINSLSPATLYPTFEGPLLYTQCECRKLQSDFFFQVFSCTIKTQQPIAIGLLSVKSMNLWEKFLSPLWPCSPPPPLFTQCCGYSLSSPVEPSLLCTIPKQRWSSGKNRGWVQTLWLELLVYFICYSSLHRDATVYFKCVCFLLLLICIADPFSSCLFDRDKSSLTTFFSRNFLAFSIF